MLEPPLVTMLRVNHHLVSSPASFRISLAVLPYKLRRLLIKEQQSHSFSCSLRNLDMCVVAVQVSSTALMTDSSMSSTSLIDSATLTTVTTPIHRLRFPPHLVHLARLPPEVEPFYGYVETTVNTLHLIHAARHGVIPRITRRLDDSEQRDMVKSGSVFIFSIKESGIKRWTGELHMEEVCHWLIQQLVGKMGCSGHRLESFVSFLHNSRMSFQTYICRNYRHVQISCRCTCHRTFSA